MNTFNEDRRNDNDEVSMMLNDLPQVDPPSSLAPTVMSTIAEHAHAPVTRPQVTFMRRGSTMAKGTTAKRVLWSVAAVAAVALVALRVAGYPPVEKGTEATIGAAQRYQAPQVSAADVKVQDQEFQSFLQSDLFRQLVNDKAAQEALKNQDLQRALADANVRTALANEVVRTAIANNASMFARLDLRNDVRMDVRNDIIANLRLDANSQAILAAALTASPALLHAISNVNIADAIANSNLALVLANSDAIVAISNQAVLNAMFNASSNARIDAVNNVSANASTNIVNK